MLPPPPEPQMGRKRRGKRTVAGEVPALAPPPSFQPITERIVEIPDVEPEIPAAPPDPSKLGELEAEEFRGVLAEIAARRMEALRLFEPMPEQAKFFASNADERLAIGGNRGGKTTTTMVEIARAVTGQDPHDKYPKEDGIFILVAIDLAKCAKVFYRKLFKPGAFYIVKDPETGQWRTFRPDQDQHLEEFNKKKAPPLIPKRFIASISWENKKDEQPKTIRLKNGWELWFYSSGGEWPQGVDVDGVAFDEEIERDGWYDEMSARLADRRQQNFKTGKVKSGKFMWSATPQSGTVQLFDLYSRAMDEQGSRQALSDAGQVPDPSTIEVYQFGIDNNPFMATHAKDAMKRKWAGKPEEYAVRIEGRFALFGSRVYSEFMPKGCHGIPSFPIPDDWTVYCAVDPGRQVCAVLFVAVPPPTHPVFGGQKIVFDELYIKNCNAQIFAKSMVEKIGHRPVEFGIIDQKGGKITDMGSGKTPEEQYASALKDVGFSFVRGGHHFQWSSSDVKSGISAVHNALHVVGGKSELVVMYEKVPRLIWEMERYSYRKLPSGLVTDDPIKVNDHLCDDVRYITMANLRYVKPRPSARKGNYVTDYLEMKKKRHAHQKRMESSHGGSIKVW
jgi:hypothetical protein